MQSLSTSLFLLFDEFEVGDCFGVAVGIGDGTDDVVPEFARRFLSGVGFHPVKVLGVGGDCQQREERKGEGLSCHSRIFFAFINQFSLSSKEV